MLGIQSRLKLVRSHDDGVDAWRMAEVSAPPQLAGLIHSYNDYAERTRSFTTRRELPHAQGVMIINLAKPLTVVGGNGHSLVLQRGEAFVAGVHLRSAFSSSMGGQAGLHVFLPFSSLRRLIGMPMDGLLDQVMPLSKLLDGNGASLVDALVDAPSLNERITLLDAALSRCFFATSPLPQGQIHALALLRDRPDLDISEVARMVGWSRKHLASRVHDAIGVGPRSWRRLIRFERLSKRLSMAASVPDWTTLAQDIGYFDHSHMIRECKEFSDLTPSEHLSRRLPNGGGLIES